MLVPRRYLSILVASIAGLILLSLFFTRPLDHSLFQHSTDLSFSSETTTSPKVVLDADEPTSTPTITVTTTATETQTESHRPAQTANSHGPLTVLNGKPTSSFKDNLKQDQKYITSWISAGWTNDVMTYGNLIYLALITDRIPIVPMFTPSHIGGGVPPIAFGEVFDVPRLSKLLGKPVLEWKDVKDPNSDFLDDLGCWNVWEAVQWREHAPRYSIVPQHLKLDISYTTLPETVKLIPKFEHDQHATFWALAQFGYPWARERQLAQVAPIPNKAHNISRPPDEQLLCYDYLYYVCAQEPYEYDFDFSPAWRYAAQYMHFLPELEDLADRYVRRGIGFADDDTRPTPPYIVIHVRHLDFSAYCEERPLYDCFASLPVIARRVEEIKAELRATKNLIVEHVVMTSDEKNETWWREVVQDFGWVRLHHLAWAGAETDDEKEKQEKTITPIKGAPEGLVRWHEWYPLLLDATVQSSGVGFVGTDRSTMSIIARRRVESWAPGGGVSRTVKWGHPDSDSHTDPYGPS